MTQRHCPTCGEINQVQRPACRACGAILDDGADSHPAEPSRLARYGRARPLGASGAPVDAETARKAALRSFDFALYGLVGFGLIFGLAAVLKGYAARASLMAAGTDRSVIAKANWAIALGILDMFIAPGLGFLIIGGVIYLLIT
jgi:hypothetical protein